MKNMKLGLQMWSIYDICVEKGLPAALKLVKDMGYDGFEFALLEHKNLKECCGADVKEVVKAMNDFDIKPIGSHLPFEPLLNNPDEILRECLELEVPYAAIGPAFYGDRTTYSEQRNIYKKVTELAKLFKKNGIQLQVHCSAFGYLLDYKGRHVVEGMFEETGLDYLQPEFDTAWMVCGEVNPIEYLHKYQSYVDVLHLKDFHPLQEKFEYLMVRHNTIFERNNAEGCAVGDYGIQDIEGILNKARECSTKWIVTELWNEKESLQNALISINNIKKYMRK